MKRPPNVRFFDGFTLSLAFDNRLHYDYATDTPNYAWSIRYVLFPVCDSGLWMWKGHVVRRLLSKRTKTAQELEA